MLQSLKKQVIFAKPMSFLPDMEMITLVKERVQQLESGEVETVTNELVFAELQKRYGF